MFLNSAGIHLLLLQVFMGPWFEDVDSPLHSGASGVEASQGPGVEERLNYGGAMHGIAINIINTKMLATAMTIVTILTFMTHHPNRSPSSPPS